MVVLRPLLHAALVWAAGRRAAVGAAAAALGEGELSEASPSAAFDLSTLLATENPFSTPTSTPNPALSMAMSRSGRTLYVGGEYGGLAWFSRNTTTGALTFKEGWSSTAYAATYPYALKSAQRLSVSSDDKFMVVSGSKVSPWGTIGIFTLAADGAPTPIYGYALGDSAIALFAPDSPSDMYTIDQSNKELRHWRYSADDGGFSVDQFVALGASGSSASTPDGLFISPDGASVYVHDSAAATNSNFGRNTTTGLIMGRANTDPLEPLSVLAGSAAVAGADGIGHWSALAFTADGTRAAALETMSGQVVALSRGASTGALALLSKTYVESAASSAEQRAYVDFRGDAPLLLARDGGADLYLVDETGDAVGWLQFDSAAGTFANALDWISAAVGPRQLLLDPTETHLYVTFGVDAASKWTGEHYLREPVPPPTPAPTTSPPEVPETPPPPQYFSSESDTLLLGETAATFLADEQEAFRAALANVTDLPLERVEIVAMLDYPAAAARRARRARRAAGRVGGPAAAEQLSRSAQQKGDGRGLSGGTAAGTGAEIDCKFIMFLAAADAQAAADAAINATINGTLLAVYLEAAAAAGIPAANITVTSMVALNSTAPLPTDPPTPLIYESTNNKNTAMVGAVSATVVFVCLGAVVAVLLARQRKLRRARKLQAEEDKYILALQASPNDALCHNNYGHFLQHMRSNYAGAERHYRLALQCDPAADYAQNSLGHLLQHVRKDFDGAEKAYREAVRLQPTNSDAHCNLGYLLQHERHDAAGAEQCYRNAIAFNADSLLAHYNMAFLQEKELGNLERAEVEYLEALRIDPKDADTQCRLAKVRAARVEEGYVAIGTATTGGHSAPVAPAPAGAAENQA